MILVEENKAVAAKKLELTDIKGVGPATAEKLIEIGKTTVEQIAVMRPEELASELQITRKAAKDMTNSAKDMALETALISRTFGEQKKHIAEVVQRIPTGSSAIDAILGGGFRTEAITLMKGEYSCHSEDTQVLTVDGVKDYNDVRIGDKIFGVDTDNNIVETIVKDKFEYDYDGKMFNFKTHRFNLKVTPNHRVFLQNKQATQFESVRADKAFNRWSGHFPSSFDWNGTIQQSFNIYDYIKWDRKLKYPLKSRFKPLSALPINDFLLLLGWYISEGSQFVCKRGSYVQIRQHDIENKNDIRELLNRLKFNFGEYEDKFVIFHQDLAKYLEYAGCSSETKQIPNHILQLSNEHLIFLFKSLMCGDGTKIGWSYSTISKILRDQMLSLSLKLGYSASFVKYNRDGLTHLPEIRGRQIHSMLDCYRINIAYRPSGYWDKRQHVNIEEYKGKVWCYTTDTGNFFTVREGTPSLSGNSGKTQLANQAAINCLKYLKRKVIWIEMESATFAPDRLEGMAKAVGLKIDPDNDFILMPSTGSGTPSTQFLAYERAIQIMEKKNLDVGLMVVDSFNSTFREYFAGREQLPDRSKETARHLGYLDKLASKYNMAILLTSQVMDIPDQGGQLGERVKTGHAQKAYGGNVLNHWSTFIISLDQMSTTDWEAVLADSPNMPKAKAKFRITEAGVRDCIGK
jgi:RecA/RadA recombinase